MDYYIVRIYRSEKDNPQKLAGIVERVGRQDEISFSRYEELWHILNEDAEKPRQGRKRSEG